MKTNKLEIENQENTWIKNQMRQFVYLMRVRNSGSRKSKDSKSITSKQQNTLKRLNLNNAMIKKEQSKKNKIMRNYSAINTSNNSIL